MSGNGKNARTIHKKVERKNTKECSKEPKKVQRGLNRRATQMRNHKCSNIADLVSDGEKKHEEHRGVFKDK